MTSLPLLESFVELQRRKFSLGVAEYLAALNALDKGFGTDSREDLIFTCQALWAKTQEQQRQIRAVLELTLPPKPTEGEWQLAMVALEQAILPPEPNGHDSVQPNPTDPLSEPTPGGAFQPDSSRPNPPPQPPSESVPNSADEKMPVGWAPGESEGSVAEPSEIALAYKPSLDFTTKLPVERRQIFQTWRYYRRWQPAGLPVELDVEGTVKSIYATGVFLGAVFLPRRANQAKLTMLIDCGGSMRPFSALADALIDSASRSGLCNRKVYYFHDVPGEYLFTDASLNDGIALETIIPSFSKTGVLIFSDGGAARGSADESRAKQTQRLIQAIQDYTPNIAWLNPMPQTRWSGTTISYLQQLCDISMFPFDRNGIEGAINTLRGLA